MRLTGPCAIAYAHAVNAVAAGKFPSTQQPELRRTEQYELHDLSRLQKGAAEAFQTRWNRS